MHPYMAAAAPTRLVWEDDFSGSTPTFIERYVTGSPDDFVGPTVSGGVLLFTGDDSGGVRKGYWHEDTEGLKNAEVRSYFAGRSGPEVQHGHVHRATDVDGTDGAMLTITRNIFAGVEETGENMNSFNFHYWTPTINQFGTSVTLDWLLEPFATEEPLWFKSRVVDKYIEFVCWFDGEDEPEYGDSDFGGGNEIPAAAGAGFRSGTGGHGIYMGHNLTGTTSSFDNVQVFDLS
jgi:hypothetical protein